MTAGGNKKRWFRRRTPGGRDEFDSGWLNRDTLLSEGEEIRKGWFKAHGICNNLFAVEKKNGHINW